LSIRIRLRLGQMIRRALAFSFSLLVSSACCQLPGVKIPEGTALAVALDRSYPMRSGTPIQGHLLYPVYVDNTLVLPEGTVVKGTVQALERDSSRRTHAMLGGDFTPFRTPLVRFTSLQLADGSSVPVSTGPASRGTPVYRAVAPERAKGGFLRQQFKAGVDAGRGDLAYFIAPGKGDRFVQWIYSQIPYHPQRIEKETTWTVELARPLDVSPQPQHPAAPSVKRNPHFWQVQPPVAEQLQAGAWRVEANLSEPLSSESSTRGQSIRAVVAEPVLNSDHSVAVPQGSTLVGSVTQAKRARWFGRSGVLTFNFNQLIAPDQQTQTVETRLTGADSAQEITLNSEGQAKSRPRDRVAIPLILAVMASSPLDQDNGHAHHTGRKNATGGAAGLGLIGTIVGLAGGSPNVAAGIGYWGLARSVVGRWIARGQKISFPKNTRIVVETVARHSAPMRADPTHTP
jgi:hypothetical protein